jgi:hypothetical protein
MQAWPARARLPSFLFFFLYPLHLETLSWAGPKHHHRTAQIPSRPFISFKFLNWLLKCVKNQWHSFVNISTSTNPNPMKPIALDHKFYNLSNASGLIFLGYLYDFWHIKLVLCVLQTLANSKNGRFSIFE